MLLSLLCMAPNVWADEIYRTVVLNVRDAQTKLLVDEIAAIESVDLREQTWFLGQVKERGMKATKLLSRPADLRFVMSGGDIDYVIHVDLERGQYEGRIYGADGELVDAVALGGEFGQVEAAQVRAMFEATLGISSDEVAAVPEGVVESVDAPQGDVVAVGAEEAPAPAPVPRAGQGGGLAVALAGGVLKRDHTFAGGNNAVLNFVSAFYPAFDLDGRYLLGGVPIGEGLLGFGVGLTAGFDSLTTASGAASILHLDGRGAILLAFGGMQLALGGRHVRYTIAQNDDFPTLVYTAVTAGLRAEHRVGKLVLSGDAEAHPWGLYGGASARLFGGKSSLIGFAATMRAGFALSDALTLRAGYGFRVERSSFPGAGTLDFADTRGFELVHGPALGISWQL